MTTSLIVIVGNYSGRDRAPVIARAGDTTAVFCDHRHSPLERSTVIAPLACQLGVETLDVHVVEAERADCDAGYHWWTAFTAGPVMTGASCGRCGTFEAVVPVPTPVVCRQRAS